MRIRLYNVPPSTLPTVGDITPSVWVAALGLMSDVSISEPCA